MLSLFLFAKEVQKKKNELPAFLSFSSSIPKLQTQQTNETQTFAIFPYSSACREKVQYCLLVSPFSTTATDNWI